jgi:hypothetical protein
MEQLRTWFGLFWVSTLLGQPLLSLSSHCSSSYFITHESMVSSFQHTCTAVLSRIDVGQELPVGPVDIAVCVAQAANENNSDH